MNKGVCWIYWRNNIPDEMLDEYRQKISGVKRNTQSFLRNSWLLWVMSVRNVNIFFSSSVFTGSGIKITTVALHSTEALMAGFLKSTELGPHPHTYGSSHHPHHTHPHGPLPPGMPPMASLAPFGLPHGLDAVGFPQGMWGKYCFFITFYYLSHL